jgi:pimeloyl-ACP methyl ester carboxylesterase
VPMLEDLPLPAGVRSSIVPGINGMDMHVLEAGSASGRPCVLLLHGFPELAFSWRKVMPALAAAGFHVIAPDQRGYGRTTGWDHRYCGDLAPFRVLNLVSDALALVAALGHQRVAAVVGHDFGSPVAAYCALTRPDVFRAVALLSAPFGGPPGLPFNTIGRPSAVSLRELADRAIRDLAALPRPRKHYQVYYSSPEANVEMSRCRQGVHDFLRAYYHMKSGDWHANHPEPLRGWTAEELARLPTYYVMDRDQTMADTVAPAMPDATHIATCAWLPDEDLAVYSAEFSRTGFQGGLQWYRAARDPTTAAELTRLSGRTIDVPSCFIAGQRDWGVYQAPGVFERMRGACTRLTGCHMVPGAGHWIQQERAEDTTRLLLDFLASSSG